MTILHYTPNRLADMAALAAFVCGSSPSSRCHCRMAAANTVFPAAKSAKQASSRRQMTQLRAFYACSRRQ